jgi:hypothetical protein
MVALPGSVEHPSMRLFQPAPEVRYESMSHTVAESDDDGQMVTGDAALRLEALLKWLLADGHITAQGARQIRKIIKP